MKLKKDFGVRALLAVICCAGFYALIFNIINKYMFDVNIIMVIISMASNPALLAIGYYFGSRTNNNPPSEG